MKRLPIQNSRSSFAVASDIANEALLAADDAKSIQAKLDCWNMALNCIGKMIDLDKMEQAKAIAKSQIQGFREDYKNPQLKDYDNSSLTIEIDRFYDKVKEKSMISEKSRI